MKVGCYNGLKVCCFGDFERFVCISIYCVSALSLHIESTDSMIIVQFSRKAHKSSGYVVVIAVLDRYLCALNSHCMNIHILFTLAAWMSCDMY